MAHLTEKYLEKLRDGTIRLSIGGLQSLSELDRKDIEVFKRVWPSIDATLRRRIVQALVELAEENVELDFAAVLKFCVNDRDAQVRKAAVEGLWEDTEPDTAELLMNVLTTDPDPTVRAEAASSLSNFVYVFEVGELDQATGEKLKATLLGVIKDSEEDLEVRRRALEAVSYLSDDAITSLLIWAYNHSDLKMRVSAVRGMGRNCDQRWLPTVFQELQSPNPELRFEAAQACGEMEDKRCVPKLVLLLKDEDVEVRLAAVTALGQVAGKAARRALVAVLESSDDPSIQEAVQEALEEIDFYEHPLGLDD